MFTNQMFAIIQVANVSTLTTLKYAPEHKISLLSLILQRREILCPEK